MSKMPCHITDGPQTPEDVERPGIEIEPDFDDELQRRLDDGLCCWCGVHPVPDWGEKCHQCKTEEAEHIADNLQDR